MTFEFTSLFASPDHKKQARFGDVGSSVGHVGALVPGGGSENPKSADVDPRLVRFSYAIRDLLGLWT